MIDQMTYARCDLEMPHFGETLKRLRDARKLSQEELAEAIGISDQRLSDLESMPEPRMHNRNYRKLAEVFGMTPEQLDSAWKETELLSKNTPLPGKFIIPRVSGVAASDFREYPVDLMNDEGVPGQLYPYPAHEPMVLRVEGESMVWDHPRAVYPGDDVIFGNALEEEIPEDALVVAKQIHADRQTVKRIHHVNKSTIELVPNNPDFPRIRCDRASVIIRLVKVVINYPYKRR